MLSHSSIDSTLDQTQPPQPPQQSCSARVCLTQSNVLGTLTTGNCTWLGIRAASSVWQDLPDGLRSEETLLLQLKTAGSGTCSMYVAMGKAGRRPSVWEPLQASDQADAEQLVHGSIGSILLTQHNESTNTGSTAAATNMALPVFATSYKSVQLKPEHVLLLAPILIPSAPVTGSVRRAGKATVVSGQAFSPEIMYNGSWYPICGHWFWDDNNGATTVCQGLGFSSGLVSSGYGERAHTSQPKAAMPVGRCNAGEALTSCSNGGNYWGDFNSTLAITGVRYALVHDGPCAGGWILGNNTRQDSLTQCFQLCDASLNCGYFAYDATSATGTNCVLYTAAAECPDDGNDGSYNAYKLMYTGNSWHCGAGSASGVTVTCEQRLWRPPSQMQTRFGLPASDFLKYLASENQTKRIPPRALVSLIDSTPSRGARFCDWR
jgi:hypothetical protein